MACKEQVVTTLPLYAVIDLGSNSFHMLITRLVANSVQTVDKVKRKVRLASGLDENNRLDEASIARGLECLSFFAERLQDIPDSNIKIVATATLRIATNANIFLTQAEKALGKKITLLSGQEEAEQIYLGVAHTSCCAKKRLVVDIGGASSELIVGEGFTTKKTMSVNIGCVSYNQHYFADGLLTDQNFNTAINAAKVILAPLISIYKAIGWESVLGGSGTMQALAEILNIQHKPAIITLTFLRQIQAELVACKTIDNIKITGLQNERTPVFASGLSILIAIFECFDIQQLQLSSGALREGLLYEMLPQIQAINIQQQTIYSLSIRFHVDQQHAQRVIKQAEFLFQHFQASWHLTENNRTLLTTSCALHEIGLLLEYKRNAQHAAYIMKNTDLPGFEQADKQLLTALIGNYKQEITTELLQHQSAVNYQQACQLLAILRIAVILCHRRRDDVLPSYQPYIKQTIDNKEAIHLCLPQQWLTAHPLISDELQQEKRYLQKIGFSLSI